MARSLGAMAGAAALGQQVDLPPGFTLIALRELGDAFAHARAVAAEAGAGTLVWVRRFDLIEFALVLEPEEPLATARLIHYAGMNALADMLAFHGPAEKPLAFGWPDSLLLDGGLLGGGRLGWPAGTAETAVPDWLVFGAMLRFSRLDQEVILGAARGTALDEEGLAGADFGALLGSFCRHFMTAANDWSELGPRAVAQRWLERFPRLAGVTHGLERNGDLVIARDGRRERRDLRAALAGAPSWLDPQGGAPWL